MCRRGFFAPANRLHSRMVSSKSSKRMRASPSMPELSLSAFWLGLGFNRVRVRVGATARFSAS